MALQRPAEGTRLGLADPMCTVKTTEEMTDSSGHENFNTEAGQWFEVRREEILLSHVQAKHPALCQMDEYVDETKPGGRRW